MGKCFGKTVHGTLLGPKDIILDMEAATCMMRSGHTYVPMKND